MFSPKEITFFESKIYAIEKTITCDGNVTFDCLSDMIFLHNRKHHFPPYLQSLICWDGKMINDCINIYKIVYRNADELTKNRILSRVYYRKNRGKVLLRQKRVRRTKRITTEPEQINRKRWYRQMEKQKTSAETSSATKS